MTRWAIVALGLMATACRSGNAVALDDARRQHALLMEQGVALDSPRFDEVLAALQRVSPSSHEAAAARRLREAIELARAPIRRPLAETHADPSSQPPDVAAQSRACARLAQLVGLDGGATDAGLRALHDCRRQLDRVTDEAHHRAAPVETPAHGRGGGR